LGSMYVNGQGVKQNDIKAVEFFQKSCEGKHALGCYLLGLACEYGEGTRKDMGQALSYFGKACDLKYWRGCIDYARLKRGR
jgi:TPR repeat protein